MNGHVFQCYEERSDPTQYNKTMDALHDNAKRELKTTDLSTLFGTTVVQPTIKKPTKLEDDADEVDQMILREEIKQYVARSKTLKSDLVALHSVTWGQCSEALKAKIKTLAGYQENADKCDCVWLFGKIGSVMQKFEETRNGPTSMMIVFNNLMSCRQGPEQKVSDYVDRLRTIADKMEHHGGNIGSLYNALTPPTLPVNNDSVIPLADMHEYQATMTWHTQTAKDLSLAALCIMNSDKVRFGTLIAHLANQFLSGQNEYPSDLTEAQGLLTNYQIPTNATRQPRVPNKVITPHGRHSSAGGASLTQTTVIAGTNGRTFADVRCYQCQSYGHYAQDCPTRAPAPPATSGTTLIQHALVLAQHKHKIDPAWIFLDSQSTISVFNNPTMLQNIRNSGRTLRAITNGGYQDSTQVGDFPNLGEVWFNEFSIANILSLADVCKVCHVTMDSAETPSINVHRRDGSIMQFVEHPSGLYVYDSNNTNSSVTAYTLGYPISVVGH